MHKPLSESLQKLRRAQRALVRRKRRSRVRVSFTHSTGSRNSMTKTSAPPRGTRAARLLAMRAISSRRLAVPSPPVLP